MINILIFKSNIMTAIGELRTFLDKFKSDKGKPFSNTSMGIPKVSVNIPADCYDTFLNLYELAITNGVELHLTEKPLDPSPIRVDLDFRFSPDINNEGISKITRKYEDKNILTIIDYYFKIINTYLEVSDEQNIAYIMEKPNPSEFRGKIKDGIHIVFPHIIVNNNIQHFIRTKILEKGIDIFNIPDICSLYEDIVDKAIISANCWLLYGSTKPDNNAYRVSKIYKYNKEEQKTYLNEYEINAKDEIDFIRLFSMRKINVKENELRNENKNDINEYIRHILPMMDKKKKEKLDSNIISNKILNMVKNFTNDDEYILAKELVSECLSHSRADKYDDWINLGWTLRNIDYRLLNTWIEFSKISSSYMEGECQQLWNKMKKENLGMGTLRWWAKEDNLQKYLEIINNQVLPLIDIAITSNGTHYDVAKVVQGIYKGEYKAVSGNIWFKYDKDKHRWIKTKEGLKLKKELSEEICKKFLDRASYYNQKVALSNDEGEKELLNKKSASAMKIAFQLKNTSYKESIMKECKCLFVDEKFEELLDSKSHLIGFENGVYDLKLHIFREGMPEDFISFETRKYFTPFDETCDEAIEINDFFSKLFVSEAVRNYVLDILACAIDGSIIQERFYIFIGEGSNGKSRLLDLIQKSIGDYYSTLPISLLTQKRASSNSAQSELERTKGRRFAILSEPSEEDKLNIGLMKELSGNDRILVRGLFKEPIEFKPQFKMILACNHLPEVTANDFSVWRRIRIINFLSKFCENPNPEKKNEFPMDLELNDKIDKFSDVFLSMLIHRHKNINPIKIIEPREVINSTNNYRDNNDLIGQYINENIMVDKDCKEGIKVMELYTDFKLWLANDNNSKNKKIDRNQFRSYFEKIYGIYNQSKGWMNIRFKTEQEKEGE